LSAAPNSSQPLASLRRELDGAPSFIADVFFLTQKSIWVGLLPALYRYVRAAKEGERVDMLGRGRWSCNQF